MIKRLVFGLIIATVLLLGAEGVARLVAGGPPQTFLYERNDTGDGYAGLVSLFPMLKPLGDIPTVNPRPADQDWFFEEPRSNTVPSWERNGQKLMHRPQDSNKVHMPKPRGVKRVFCLGGSTVFGIPGAEDGAFSDFLQKKLGRSFEVHNLGNPALDTFDLLEITRETTKMSPDLYVIYTGHNDVGNAYFFGRYLTDTSPGMLRMRVSLWNNVRIYSLIRGALIPLKAELSAGALDFEAEAEAAATRLAVRENQRLAVRASYRSNLEQMVASARGAGADVVFVQPASDLMDTPGASAHFKRLSEAEREAFDAALKLGKKRDGRASLEEAVAIDPTYAEASWRLGQVLLEAGEVEEARRLFIQAKEWDVVSLRAWTVITDTMAEVSEALDVPMISAEAVLMGEDGLPDPKWFSDNLHLNTPGHGRLSEALLPVVQDASE